MAEALMLPRRIAIALLAEAQKAPGGQIRGLVGARAGQPVALYPATDSAAEKAALARLQAQGQTLWAVFHSGAGGGRNFAVPELVIRLDTKGVLELRCRPAASDVTELEVRIVEA